MPDKKTKLSSTNLIIIFSVICILVVLGLIIASITNKSDVSVNNTSSSSSISIPLPSSSSVSSSNQSVSDPSAPDKPPVPIIIPNGSN